MYPQRPTFERHSRNFQAARVSHIEAAHFLPVQKKASTCDHLEGGGKRLKMLMALRLLVLSVTLDVVW